MIFASTNGERETKKRRPPYLLKVTILSHAVQSEKQMTIDDNFLFKKRVRVFLDFKKFVQSIMFLHAYYEISEIGAFLKGTLRGLSGNTKGKCLRK